MTPEMKDYLKTKLVDTCLHLKKTEADKKASMAGFSEEIKGSKEKIDALTQAIASECVEGLVDAYGYEYVEYMEKEAAK